MEEKKTWAVGAGSGIGWLKALLVSYLISVLLLLLLSFLLWKFSWKESWVQAGIVVIYLASSFSGGRMAGNMAGKRRFLWGICFGIVYFAILIIVSAVFLPGGFAGAGRDKLCRGAARLCAAGKPTRGSSLCRRRNGRRNDGTRQIKADKTEHFFKKQTFKFEKPML